MKTRERRKENVWEKQMPQPVTTVAAFLDPGKAEKVERKW